MTLPTCRLPCACLKWAGLSSDVPRAGHTHAFVNYDLCDQWHVCWRAIRGTPVSNIRAWDSASLAHACPPCDLERSPGNNWFSLNFIRTPFHLVKGRIILHFWKKPLPQKTRVVSLSTQDREGGTLWLSWWETVGQLWTTGGFQVSLCPLEVCSSCFPPYSPSLPGSSLPLYGVRCPGLGWRWLKAMRSSHIYLLASPFLQDTYVPPARQSSRVRFMGGRLRRCGR